MIRRLKLLFCAVLGTLAMSCSDWLKVSSEDRIMENDLFRTSHGFMTSLNGIYIDLLNSSLYGKTLTWVCLYFGPILHLSGKRSRVFLFGNL